MPAQWCGPTDPSDLKQGDRNVLGKIFFPTLTHTFKQHPIVWLANNEIIKETVVMRGAKNQKEIGNMQRPERNRGSAVVTRTPTSLPQKAMARREKEEVGRRRKERGGGLDGAKILSQVSL